MPGRVGSSRASRGADPEGALGLLDEAARTMMEHVLDDPTIESLATGLATLEIDKSTALELAVSVASKLVQPAARDRVLARIVHELCTMDSITSVTEEVHQIAAAIGHPVYRTEAMVDVIEEDDGTDATRRRDRPQRGGGAGAFHRGADRTHSSLPQARRSENAQRGR